MNKRHGMAKRIDGKLPKIYSIWVGMKDRCTNPKSANWPRYGGRGIKLCERWMKFDNFYEDMGNPPSEKHTIDRIDNDGDYRPGNVKWSTNTEQSRNRSSSNKLMLDGKVQTLTEWALELGIKRVTLSNRLNLYGWSVKEALTTPVSNGGPTDKKPRRGETLKDEQEKRQRKREEEAAKEAANLIEYRGERKALAAWCAEKGLTLLVVRRRLKYGWTIDRALETPARDWGPNRKRPKTPESPD